MSAVQPIKGSKNIKLCEKHIKQNHDHAYHLVFKLGVDTGYRISDLINIRYENIDFHTGKVTVVEQKGTKANAARARLKVLSSVKNELIAYYSDNTKKMMSVFITPPKDIYSLVPGDLKSSIDDRIKKAMDSAPQKIRVTKISEKTLTLIRARQRKYKRVDGGYIFSKATFKNSNRAINQEGVISRQSCWRVFKTLTGFLASIGDNVSVGCHSLRKAFVYAVYVASGNDIALAVKLSGHSSVTMTMKYLGMDDSSELAAIEKMHSVM